MGSEGKEGKEGKGNRKVSIVPNKSINADLAMTFEKLEHKSL